MRYFKPGILIHVIIIIRIQKVRSTIYKNERVNYVCIYLVYKLAAPRVYIFFGPHLSRDY